MAGERIKRVWQALIELDCWRDLYASTNEQSLAKLTQLLEPRRL